jgi:hypothetical protein
MAQGVRQQLVNLGVLMPVRPLTPSFPAYTPLERMPWLAEGACVGHPTPDIFGAPATAAERSAAKRICYTCHVRLRCLEFAVQVLPRSNPGIWGGTTSSERSHIRRSRGIPPRPYGRPAIEAARTTCGVCDLPLSGPNLAVQRRADGGTRRICRNCRRIRNRETMRALRQRRREAAAAASAAAGAA